MSRPPGAGPSTSSAGGQLALFAADPPAPESTVRPDQTVEELISRYATVVAARLTADLVPAYEDGPDPRRRSVRSVVVTVGPCSLDHMWSLVWCETTGWSVSPAEPDTGQPMWTVHLHRELLPKPGHVVAWMRDRVFQMVFRPKEPKRFRAAGDHDTIVDQLRAAAAYR